MSAPAWDWTPETLGRLQTFLTDCALTRGPLRTKAIGDGHSNLTYLVSDGENEVVVRRPPPPPVPPGGHDVLREAKLIAALPGTGVPVPEVLAVGQAGEVLDVPFYVMSYVEGIIATTEAPPGLDGRGIAFAMVDALKALHAVDFRARGLEGFGRPEGFNARHLRRMAGLVAGPLRAVRGDLRLALGQRAARVGRVDPARRLPARQPDARRHAAGAHRRRARLGAGHARRPAARRRLLPRLLSGARASRARRPRTSAPPRSPTAGRRARSWRERYGVDASQLRWYTVMATWKLAVLYEYSRRRGEDAYYADPSLVERFLASAHRQAGLDTRVNV